MKKILLAMFLVFSFALRSCADELWRNDLRDLFLADKAVIYVINIRTFNADDTDKNEIVEPEKGEVTGNFVNAVNRLDELKSMGINTVHILPITKTSKLKSLGTAGSLYSLASFLELNDQLDDTTNSMNVYDEAKNFIDECHSRNIRVIVDMPSCGGYDFYLNNPDLFLLDKDGQPIAPADWTDVRLYKTLEKDNSINEELYDLHVDYIDMAMSLGADGIRADVATIKPYEFWQMLIQYSRRKDPHFLFMAEASKAWTTPPTPEAVFTDYQKLLSAGFDGVLGDYMNFKEFKTPKDLLTSVEDVKAISQRLNSKKAIVGNFATHDDISPMLVNSNYPVLLAWMSATLPLNTYFVDGFATGDYYIYPYSNKIASVTHTDDNYYYTHKGKLDIFNFSRKPGGEDYSVLYNFKLANNFKQMYGDVIENGVFKVLKTSNPKIFAYQYTYKDSMFIVAYNSDATQAASGVVYINKVKRPYSIDAIKSPKAFEVKGNRVVVNFDPSDVLVLVRNISLQTGKKN